MNVLTQLHTHLPMALMADPLNRLALLVATLDPYWQSDEDSLSEAFDMEDTLMQAALVTRQAFPDLYADLVLAQANTSSVDLEWLLLEGFKARGLPLDTLEGLASGIPFSAFGLCLEEPTMYRDHPELIQVLSWFGVDIMVEADSIEIPNEVYQIGAALGAALVDQPDTRWQDVGLWLGWVFGATGNSLIDLTDEMLYEIPALGWTPDDVAFACELIAEAHDILDRSERAAGWLQREPAAVTTLKRVIGQTRRGLRQYIKRTKHRKRTQQGDPYVPHLRLDGPAAAHSPS